MSHTTEGLAARYVLGERIGRGGNSDVYRAVQRTLKRPVVIKIARHGDDPFAMRRFTREAQVLSSLRHPHVLELIDFGDEDGQYYMVYPLVEGMVLREVLSAGAPPLRYALRLFAQIAAALAHAHAAGVVHRDVKPENVLVAREGGARLFDFGLAIRPADTRLTGSGSFIGTIAYAAPEQLLEGSTSASVDLYALGVVGYELFTGTNPFLAKTVDETATRHLHTLPGALPPLPAAVPAPVRDLVLALLAKAPADRPASAAEVHRAITASNAPEPPEPEPPRPRRAASAPPPRGPGASLALGVAFGVLAMLLAAASTTRAPEPAPPATPAPTAPALEAALVQLDPGTLVERLMQDARAEGGPGARRRLIERWGPRIAAALDALPRAGGTAARSHYHHVRALDRLAQVCERLAIRVSIPPITCDPAFAPVLERRAGSRTAALVFQQDRAAALAARHPGAAIELALQPGREMMMLYASRGHLTVMLGDAPAAQHLEEIAARPLPSLAPGGRYHLEVQASDLDPGEALEISFSQDATTWSPPAIFLASTSSRQFHTVEPGHVAPRVRARFRPYTPERGGFCGVRYLAVHRVD